MKSKIKKSLIKYYLSRKNVTYQSLPNFSGKWPKLRVSGKLVLGRSCHFRSFRSQTVVTVSKDALLEIGDRSYINDGVNICSTKNINIGAFAKIGDYVTIYDTNFHQIEPDKDTFCSNVIIGKNVWVGAFSIILQGVNIGDHSVIGASSVVVSDIPPKVVAVGNPAKVIRTFECDDDWIRK